MKHYKKKTAAKLGASIAIASMTSAVGLSVSSTSADAAAEGCSPVSTYFETYFQVCLATGPKSNNNFVDYIDSWGSARLLLAPSGCYHIELVGPSIPANWNGTTSCFTALQSGLEAVSGPTWQPEKNVKPGQYCAILWHENQSGSYSNVQEACIGVN